MTVGYLADSFDMINVRDLDLVAQARALCSRLVVGVFTDEYAEQLLGRRPIVPFAERLLIIRHLRGVDDAVEHNPDAIPLAGVHFLPADRLAAAVPGEAYLQVLVPMRGTNSAVLRDALSTADMDTEAVA
jgi:bifunctional ADP-heptose synthase (sugar kinase/adenylyltransferase)